MLSVELAHDMASLENHSLNPGIAKHFLNNVLRSVAALSERGEKYEHIYARVASPGGTTDAANNYAQSKGFYEIVENLAESAILRCRE